MGYFAPKFLDIGAILVKKSLRGSYFTKKKNCKRCNFKVENHFKMDPDLQKFQKQNKTNKKTKNKTKQTNKQKTQSNQPSFEGENSPEGVLRPKLFMDVPAAPWIFNFLNTNFLHNYQPNSIPFLKEKHPILLKLGVFFVMICSKYTQFM